MQNQMDRIEWKLDQILSHLLSQTRSEGESRAGNASQTHHQMLQIWAFLPQYKRLFAPWIKVRPTRLRSEDSPMALR